MVRDLGRTLRRYCKGWIILDMLASIPWEWIPNGGGQLRFTKSFQIAKITRVMKCMRLARLLREELIPPKMQIMIESNPSFAFIYGIGHVLLLIFSVTHISACFWYMVGNNSSKTDNWIHGLPEGLRPTSVWDRYLSSFYFTLTTMTTVGYGDVTVANYSEVGFVLVLLLVASIVFSYLMGTLVGLLDDFRSGHNSLAQKKLLLSRYLSWRQVPEELWHKIRCQLLMVWESNEDYEIYERGLKDSLTPKVRAELCYHVYGKILCQTPFLSWMNGVEPSVVELASRVSEVFLTEGDCLFRLGTPNNCAFILTRGKVLITKNVKLQHSYKHMANLGPLEVPRSTRGKPHTNPLIGGLSNMRKLGYRPSQIVSNQTEFLCDSGDLCFKQGSDALALRDLAQHVAARRIQLQWRSFSGRSENRFHHNRVEAPAFFGESCLMEPFAEWDKQPHMHPHTAVCESPCEAICVSRCEVKEVMEKFSPMLAERFEFFRRSVLASSHIRPQHLAHRDSGEAQPAETVSEDLATALRSPLLSRGP